MAGAVDTTTPETIAAAADKYNPPDLKAGGISLFVQQRLDLCNHLLSICCIGMSNSCIVNFQHGSSLFSPDEVKRG